VASLARRSATPIRLVTFVVLPPGTDSSGECKWLPEKLFVAAVLRG
jgi:hypothetical protein